MYIEFSLPKGFDGAPARSALRFIRSALHQWSDKHDIPYTSQLVEGAYRIQFDDVGTYSFFLLTWGPNPKLHSTAMKRIAIVDADLPNDLIIPEEEV